MPTVQVPVLRDLTQQIFEAVGTPTDLATILAEHLVDANLAGHDSHGVMRIQPYVQNVRDGQVIPDARPTVIEERPATALVSGNWGFGHVATTFATDLAARKAKQGGVAVVGIAQCNHIGRVGAYPTQAAAQGVASFVVVGGLSGSGSVVPFGGREGRLSTNPLSFGFPAGSRPPFLVDFATSTVAGGKVMLASAKGEAVPEGALLDAEGNPTTDPRSRSQGGVMLPFGGHKGYGLSLVVGLFGGLLTHSARHAGQQQRGGGTFIMAVDSGLFGPLDALEQEVDTAFARIKDTPPVPGVDEVLIPGEPEHRTRNLRLKEGIPVPSTTWDEIGTIAGDLGVSMPPIPLVE
ncbi:dehydrogenase [Candidatus Woesearchaeota archaeon]|nr:dehydrogenase [Candidatus Woesearchaeota archaeon]